MKIDPYKHEENYLKWKEEHKDGIPELSKENSNLLLQYLKDMEIGINVATESKKGARSFIRLVSLKNKLRFIMKKMDELHGVNNITTITEEQALSFFSDMINGIIVKENGKKYTAVRDYIKIFKAFWHWWQKVNKKKGIDILDITSDLDCEQAKPDWVYLKEEQIKMLCEKAKYDYKVLMMFLFDTGIRAPTELMNVKVSDFMNNFKELNIREETVKRGSFGRRIKLMLSSSLIKEYIRAKNLSTNDYLFTKHPTIVNQYLKRLARDLFGDKQSPAGQKYSELTMYDFRHNACCYWLPRYKSESALKYRFGWKSSDKIHYYSELLGMKDTISEEDLLVDVTKTELEQRLNKTEKINEIMQERMKTIELKFAEIMGLSNQVKVKVKNAI